MFSSPIQDKRCFVYCGDDNCTCSLKRLRANVLDWQPRHWPMTFDRLREKNISREARWHTTPEGEKIESWSPERMIVAMMGELGEACNNLKKIWRYEEGLAGNKEDIETLRANVRKEFGDVQVYFDLVCLRLGIDLGEATREVFNAKSEQLSFPERL